LQQLAAGAAAPAGSAVQGPEAWAQVIQTAVRALQASQPAPAAGGRGGAGGGGAGGGRGGQPFEVPYTEKLQVGYKWYDAQDKAPLFPFGFGLSFTSYSYSGLKAAESGHDVTVSFTVRNTGKRAGKEIAQVYASLPESTNEPPKRLIGWQKLSLGPGESKTVSLTIDPVYLSYFNESADHWQIAPGSYKIMAGSSSRDLPLSQAINLD